MNCANKETKEIWLDEMDLSSMTSGWKTPQKNKSILGRPMIMNNKTYDRGVGVHAKSKYMVELNGEAKTFTAVVGLDDNAKEMSSITIYILGDKKIMWESGVLKKGQVKNIDINIEGIKVLAFYVSDAKDGQSRDYANFANAKFLSYGTIEPYIPLQEEKIIVTPSESLQPKINGPDIFGIRKDSPFLYKIPASGKKPIIYEVDNLPKGLNLDSLTGIITGKMDVLESKKIILKAKNEHGNTKKEFEIVVGDNISLTPPMGWNSWNCWGKNVNQEKIEAASKAFVDKGLIDYGWSYIVIDDAWQGNRDNKKKMIRANAMFPDMKNLSKQIHDRGLKFGIYSTPWITSFAGYCGTSSDSINGYWDKEKFGNRKFIKHGKYTFEKNDVDQFVDWGVDYLKYDWNPIDSISLARMGKEIKNANRDIVFSISNSSDINDMKSYQKWSNLWRTTSDIRDIWDNGYSKGRFSQGIMDILRYHTNWKEFNGPSSWNDPDMLVLGKVGWGEPRENNLSGDELYSHFTLWTIWSAPLMLGCDLEKIDKFTLSLLKNSEVIDINQDRLGSQAEIISDTNGFVVLKKQLYNGDFAIAVINKGLYYNTPIDQFNWGDEAPRELDLKELKITLNGDFMVRDVWKQKNIEEFSKSQKIKVNHHGASLLRFKRVKKP
ncbi:NPCBM/NEW2 domain-containing protein [Aquimarina mytili]